MGLLFKSWYSHVVLLCLEMFTWVYQLQFEVSVCSNYDHDPMSATENVLLTKILPHYESLIV